MIQKFIYKFLFPGVKLGFNPLIEKNCLLMSKTNPHPSREGHPRGFRYAGAFWINENPVKQQGCVL